MIILSTPSRFFGPQTLLSKAFARFSVSFIAKFLEWSAVHSNEAKNECLSWFVWSRVLAALQSGSKLNAPHTKGGGE